MMNLAAVILKSARIIICTYNALHPLPKALAKSGLYGSPGWALYLLVGPGGGQGFGGKGVRSSSELVQHLFLLN